jgi:glycosyltransferase involved in cell wall biosynthesis
VGRLRVGVDGYPVSGRRTGIGRYTAELLTAAARAGAPDVTFDAVLFGHHPEGPPEVDDLVAAGIRVHRPSAPRALVLRAGLKARLPMPLTLVLPDADVLLYTNYRWYPAGGRPTVTFVYDLGYLHHRALAHPTYVDVLRRQAERAVERSDRIAVISETMAAELASAYPSVADRLVVVPPAPTTMGRPLTAGAVAARLDALGLAPGFLLHIGTIEPRKNLTRLVAALALLPPDRRLVLVGNRGWSEEPILRAIRDAGDRVVQLGFLPDLDVQALLRGAALLVCPSLYEGFGLPVIEALAAGTPVACADIPVFREVAGDAAAYFDPARPAAIAEVVAGLLADEGARGRLAHAGPARAARYTWASAADRLLRVLGELTPGLASARR